MTAPVMVLVPMVCATANHHFEVLIVTQQLRVKMTAIPEVSAWMVNALV
jgi:hypothetical protein